jgi:hypothetical protein
MDAGTLYVLGGRKEAKKLKSELTYKLVNGQYVGDSKTDYIYNGTGRIDRIEHFGYRSHQQVLLMADQFEYRDGRVYQINRFDAQKGGILRSTNFQYDNQGKVVAMEQTEGGVTTKAKVTYHYGINPGAQVQYTYSNTTVTTNYYLAFGNGNVTSGSSVSSNDNTATGQYEYDTEINPYAHMGWPDLFFSRFSRNNLKAQQKTYYGAYPAEEPYSFKYTYDNDGYPKELVRDYKHYFSTERLYTTKTVYTY